MTYSLSNDILQALAKDDPEALRLPVSADINGFYQWTESNGSIRLRSLLQLAAMFSAPKIVFALLQSGASATLASPSDGKTPLKCACEHGITASSAQVIANLVNHGADSNQFTEHISSLSMPNVHDNEHYQTDEFRMFSFKIEACPRLSEMHDWTECPFLHPGEKARRRDPRVFPYHGIPCPEFRKGNCRRGDACPFAHGVFECWLHPSRYRTQLCKEGSLCTRKVCFFAHSLEQLREPENVSQKSNDATQVLSRVQSELFGSEGSRCPSPKIFPSATAPECDPCIAASFSSSASSSCSDFPQLSRGRTAHAAILAAVKAIQQKHDEENFGSNNASRESSSDRLDDSLHSSNLFQGFSFLSGHLDDNTQDVEQTLLQGKLAELQLN